jgi:hypothetical protein
MDASEIAKEMLRWETMKKELDALTSIIQEEVLQMGKTQTVGNVRATYSAGRKTYDYHTAGAQADPEVWERHAIKSYDWKAICETAGITDIPFTQSEPNVSVKLIA